jgi:hypothetical protein
MNRVHASTLSSVSLALLLSLVCFGLPETAHAGTPLSTAFSFQGELKFAGVPAHGPHDVELGLFSGPEATNEIDARAFDDVPVVDGLFTVAPDFTEVPFQDGYAMWIEVRVRSGDSNGAYTTLSPRQPLQPVPYAMGALHVAREGVESEDIQENAIGGREIDAAQIQMRVGAGCTVGSSIRSIGQDGAVTCQAAGITGVVAGTGLSGGGTSGAPTMAIDENVTQRRVAGSCPAGQYLRAIGTDGQVTCAADAAPSITGYQIITTTCNLFAGSNGTSSCYGWAVCPSITKIIGGGVYSECAGTLLQQSGPRILPGGVHQWSTWVIKPSGIPCPDSTVVSTYAICANVN